MRVAMTVAAVLCVLGLAACGGSSVAAGAESTIEGDLEEQIGLGALTASCDEPVDNVEGGTFDCTASTEDGRTIEFLGTLTETDRFRLVTTNLLTGDDIQAILPLIASSISDEIGQPVAVEDLTCPDEAVILDEDGNFPCEIIDRESGDSYDLTIKTGGLEPGVGARDLGWEIGNQIP